jgi:hypothetical protein
MLKRKLYAKNKETKRENGARGVSKSVPYRDRSEVIQPWRGVMIFGPINKPPINGLRSFSPE